MTLQKKMKKLLLVLIIFCTGAFMLFKVETNAAVQNATVVITKNGQTVDKFCNVKSNYILSASNTGNYCCAAYVKKFYAALYNVNVYQINTYAGPPKVSSTNANVSLQQVSTPQPGDIMQNVSRTHVAIVKKVSGNTVTLIEQNWKWTMGGVVYARVNRTINADSAYFYRLLVNGKAVSPASSATTPVPDDHEVWQIASAGGVNLRKTRSVTSTLLGTIPYGSIVNVTAKKNVNGYTWGKVTYNSKTGWFMLANGCYVWGKITRKVVDNEAPVISDVKMENLSVDGYTVTCTVTDNVGVARVQFPTWTSSDGQDDLISDWTTNAQCSGTKNGNTYSFVVKRLDHNNEYGVLNTHIYAYDSSGNCSSLVFQPVELGIASLDSVFYAYLSNVDSGKYLSYTDDYACVMKRKVNDSQLWKFTRKSNGYYVIDNVSKEKRLSAFTSNDKLGMKVMLETPRSINRQWWRIYGDNDTGYVLKSAITDYVIMLKQNKTANGTKVRLNAQKNSSTSKFIFNTVKRLKYVKITKVSNAGNGLLKISWNRTTDCDGFEVFRLNSTTNRYVRVKNVSKSKSSCGIKDTGEKNVVFRIRSYKKNENGIEYSVFSSYKYN